MFIVACKKSRQTPMPVNPGNVPKWINTKFTSNTATGISAMLVTAGGKILVGVSTQSAQSLYFSTDTGVSWHLADSLHTAKINGSVLAIKQDPITGTILMGCNATQLNGLFTSTDNGKTWVNNPYTFAPLDFAFMNNEAYMVLGNGVSPNPPQYMLSSTNDFSSQWIDCSNYSEIPTGYRLYTDNNTLFVGLLSVNALYRSNTPESRQYARTDTGIVYSTPGVTSVNRMIRAGNYLFTGTTDGIFRSGDGGHNWTESSTGFSKSANDFAVIGTDLYVALTDSAIYKSSDNGASWQPYHLGLTLPLTVTCLQVTGNYLIAGDNNTNVYKIKTK